MVSIYSNAVRFEECASYFQRLIDVLLSTVKWQQALASLEDIVIFSKTPDDHIEHTRSVLYLLKDANVTLKLNKCPLLQIRYIT